MDIQEAYSSMKAKYDVDVKPLWKEHPSAAYLEFLNFYDTIGLIGNDFKKYHSGPLLFATMNVMVRDIKKNMKFDSEHLDKKLISDDFVEQFEATFAQLGLAIKSGTKF